MKKGIAGAAFAVALLGYVVLAVLAHSQQWFFFDPPITRFIQGFRNPVLDTVMEVISYPGYPPQFLFFFGAVLVVFLILKLRVEAVIMVLGLVGVGAIGFAVKPLVHRLRPPASQVWIADPYLLKQDPYSFTAGHVHTYMVVVGWSVFLAISLLPKRSIWRRLAIAAGLLFLLLLGFSRFYLGDHWFSDVVGAYLLGGIGLGIEILAYDQVQKRWPDKLRRQPELTTVRAGHGAIKRAAANPVLELLERLGYMARGALYSVMGLLALGVALGVGGGQTTDLSGSLVFLIGNPFGKLVLIGFAIGLAAYSLWGFVRAIYDPLHRGSDASGYVARLGFVTSALSYAAIVAFALQILVGSGGASADSTQKTIAAVLTRPAGGWLTILIGLFAAGIGLGQFVEAYRATFKKDLKGSAMPASAKDIAVGLGRFGMVARGVTFLVIGWFVIQAGIHHDAGQAQGFGGAFLFLLGQPFGRLLLGITALGFVALGLHSFACARWIRLLGSSA